MLSSSSMDEWQSNVAEMTREVRALKDARLWRSGHRTLMRELGLHNREVSMCRAVAWLMTPDAWHGLGSDFLFGFLELIGVSTEGVERASVTTEEVRGDTRADIVIRTHSATVLIEAKLDAAEGPEQADRLAEGWEGEDPQLVFLTRGGASPVTAVRSAGRWSTLTWPDLADVGREVIERLESEAVAPGARDLVATLAREKENSGVNDDAKTQFYLKHRELITEWAILHDQAVKRLDEQLVQAFHAALSEQIHPADHWDGSSKKTAPRVQLKVAGSGGRPGGFFELQWRPAELLRPGHKFTWPQFIICSDPRAGVRCRQEVEVATVEIARKYEMTFHPTSWWVSYLPFQPDEPLADLDGYASDCVSRFFELWEEVRPALAIAHEAALS